MDWNFRNYTSYFYKPDCTHIFHKAQQTLSHFSDNLQIVLQKYFYGSQKLLWDIYHHVNKVQSAQQRVNLNFLGASFTVCESWESDMVFEEGWETVCVLLSSLCLSLLQPPNRPLQRSTEPKHTTWRETWICCSTKYYQNWPIIAPQHNLSRGPQAWLQPQAQSQLQGQTSTPVSALILSGSRVLSLPFHTFFFFI